MIEPQEKLYSLSDAAALCPEIEGKTPAPATLWRWHRRGLRGVHLETVRVGRRVCTSKEALHRFFTALAAAAGDARPGRPPPRGRSSERVRQERVRRANERLDQAGI